MNGIFEVKPNIIENIDYELIESIEQKIKDKLEINDNEIYYLLVYICYKVREKLSIKKQKELSQNNFENQCDTAQSMIYHYFENFDLTNIAVNIHEIIDEITGHSFNVIQINGKNYLIDPTYIQFFDEKKCDESNFIFKDRIILKTPHPGHFVQDTKSVENLLKYGFVPLDEDIARIYGDSFYKTKTGVEKEKIETETMPGTIYIKAFLKSKSIPSKTEEELEKDGLLLKPIKQNKKNTKTV